MGITKNPIACLLLEGMTLKRLILHFINNYSHLRKPGYNTVHSLQHSPWTSLWLTLCMWCLSISKLLESSVLLVTEEWGAGAPVRAIILKVNYISELPEKCIKHRWLGPKPSFWFIESRFYILTCSLVMMPLLLVWGTILVETLG